MFRSMAKKLASKVLDSDSTSKPVSQIEFLKDFLSKHKYVFSKDFEENLSILKRKHLVDSFMVTNFDGSLVVSSEGNGHSEGMIGTAMMSYINSELPGSEVVLIKKDDGWFMLFALNKKVFIVKAGSELSSIELKALAIELTNLMQENQHNSQHTSSSVQDHKKKVKEVA
ncbi:MAG: hypothetical protein AABW59_05635 [archaeon]